MKNQRTKYIKVRMTPEEVQQFKEKSATYSSVSHYIRSALAEYSNIGINRLSLMLSDPSCPFALFVGKKKLIKRRAFEEYINSEAVHFL